MRVLSFVGMMLLAPSAWALTPDLDPTVTQSIGLREDAVGKLAKDPAATNTLIEVLHADPSPEVRARAGSVLFDRWAKGIGDRDAHRAIALWAADHADDGIRASAVRALGDVGDDIQIVLPYLDDENAGVRAAAYSACERWTVRHPDEAADVHARLAEHPPDMAGKARLLMEKVKSKMP